MVNRYKQPDNKDKGRKVKGNTVSADETEKVVHSQDDGATAGGWVPWMAWAQWNQRGMSELAEQQRELVDWGSRVGRCWSEGESAKLKVTGLVEALMGAWVAAAGSGTRMAVDQQRRYAGLAAEARAVLQSGSTVEIQAWLQGLWPIWADSARSWGLIPVASQARLAGAWAEFWCLAASEEAECEAA